MNEEKSLNESKNTQLIGELDLAKSLAISMYDVRRKLIIKHIENALKIICESSSGQVDDLLDYISEEIKYLDQEYTKWKDDHMHETAAFWHGRLEEARYLGTQISRKKSKII